MLIATNDRLKQIAREIDVMEQERRALSADIKERYDIAKSEGFTVKALKQAIKIHSMDQDKRAKHDAEQMDLELYLQQLEGKVSE
jgi:uncharacterized protein (UPF0335 family)